MIDIVERLRQRVDVAERESRFGDAEDCRDAADEIERLRAGITRWQEIASQGITMERELRREMLRKDTKCEP